MKKSVLTQNKGCRLEPSCHAELVSASCCCNKAVMGAVSHDNKYGFTMVEILVAVLIIAVLVIVAVPQYQKSILKSRFSSLMPTAKTIRDSQESYYLQHSRYATQMSDLDVKAAQTGGMDISFGEGTNADFKYVLASRPALHNNLIMYQKQSPKFAGHTHCEALKSDGNANWLCNTALHGQLITGSISGSNYNTYILEGVQGENDKFTQDCPPSGATQACACGDPLEGTCDETSGTWSYAGSCSVKPEDFTVEVDGTEYPITYQCDSANKQWVANWTASGGVITDKVTANEAGQYATMLFTYPAMCGAKTKNGCSWAEFTNGARCIGGKYEDACSYSEFTNGSQCTASLPGVCGFSTFTGSASRCAASAAGGCAGSTFTDNAYCGSSIDRGCEGAIVTNGGYCSGQRNGGCSGAIIGDGGYCSGDCGGAIITSGGECRSGCANALIKAGGKCVGYKCDQAVYQGGCCTGDHCPAEHACPD